MPEPTVFRPHDPTEAELLPASPATGGVPLARPLQPDEVPVARPLPNVVSPGPESWPIPQPAAPPAEPSTAPVGSPEEDAALVDISPVVRDSPPWLLSAVLHMMVMIVFGLWLVSAGKGPRLVIDAEYSEDIGEQLIEESLDLAPETEFEMEEQLITPDELPDVEDPLATPAITEISPNANSLAGTIEPISVGLALSGRSPGRKQALLSAYGGNASTEAAVTLGLKWLVRQQRRNGLWSLRGPYDDGSGIENLEAATAMALLAFQGAGNTRQEGPFQREVNKGWTALLKRLDDDGNFFHGTSSSHRFYTHAQCAIALCELYGMTRDEELHEPAQRSVDYLVNLQQDEGGWRYYLDRDSDLSVTGWVLMALQSARMAGLEVPSQTFDRVNGFLDLVSREDGQFYAYRKREGAKLSMTAEGLLCRQYLGWSHNDERLRGGVEELLNNLPTWERGKRNVYYWYYATQVCHHMEGYWWERWNEVMRQVLPENQEKRGAERGSWDPDGDRWGPHGGRLYVTCLSIYMLEVYYRHLPIYQSQMIEAGL